MRRATMIMRSAIPMAIPMTKFRWSRRRLSSGFWFPSLPMRHAGRWKQLSLDAQAAIVHFIFIFHRCTWFFYSVHFIFLMFPILEEGPGVKPMDEIDDAAYRGKSRAGSAYQYICLVSSLEAQAKQAKPARKLKLSKLSKWTSSTSSASYSWAS